MRRYLLLPLLVLAWSRPLAPQSAPTWDPQGLKMERAELEELLGRLEGGASSVGYGARIRESARRNAELIRDRLANGDFRLGDRVVLRVEGEEEIPDTLAVENGPKITLPIMGPISLEGVLRSELEAHLTKELGRFIHQPVIQAESLIRLGIIGSVGRQGFYTVPADMLLGEALMFAGGPAPSADLNKVRIERTGDVLWDSEELRTVLAEGRTLDQLNLRAGDQIVLPAQPTGGSGWWSVGRWIAAAATSVFFGVRVFF
jgi:hypothetical protein